MPRRPVVIDQDGDHYLVDIDGAAHIYYRKALIPKNAIWDLRDCSEDAGQLAFEEGYPELLEGNMGRY